MRRSSLARHTPLSPRAKTLHRAHTSGLLEKLSSLYPLERYALFTEVRNIVGLPSEPGELTSMDALAIPIDQAELLLHGFEWKLTRDDFRRERRWPGKGDGLRKHCTYFSYVVPAPWKKVVLSTELELGEGEGLIEIGTGGARLVEPPVARVPVPLTTELVLALLHRASQLANARAEVVSGVAGVDAPLSLITRRISKFQVGLMCGHVAPAPLGKKPVPAVHCFACAAGLPGDRALIRQAIDEASPEELHEYRDRIAARLGERTCACRDVDPVFCMKATLEGMGISAARAAQLSLAHSCLCACHATHA